MDENTPEEHVYKYNEKLETSPYFYNMPFFSMQLNYMTDSLKERLPHTDSRLRPDQRALENGDTELAVSEKHRLEEAQRLKRREHEKNGTDHVPAYFVVR